jgi:hypothetical protein
MSTDIIKFSDNKKEYQWGALHWFMMVTVPFMVATFAAWYGFHLWAARKEKQELAMISDLEKQNSSDASKASKT